MFRRFWEFFSKKPAELHVDANDQAEEFGQQWELIPSYVEVEDAEQRELVSVIATSIAAGDNADSHFVVKSIKQKNPELIRISVIAAAIATSDSPDTHYRVKHVYQYQKP